MVTAVLWMLLAPGRAAAEHGSPWLEVSPDIDQPLPVNGRITIFSVNGSAHIHEIDAYAPRLVADDGSEVPLRVVEYWQGADWAGYGVSAVILAPVTELVPNTGYTLVALEAPGATTTSPFEYARNHRPAEMRWTTEPADTAPPALERPLTEHAGSELAEIVSDVPRIYMARVSDASALLLRLTVDLPIGTRLVALSYFTDSNFGLRGCARLDNLRLQLEEREGSAPPAARMVAMAFIDAAGNETPVAQTISLTRDVETWICLEPLWPSYNERPFWLDPAVWWPVRRE